MSTTSITNKCCNGHEDCLKKGVYHDTCSFNGLPQINTPKPLAERANSGKPQLTFIPYEAQKQEALVWMFGAKKYSRDNWRKGLSFLSVCDSILRHINAYIGGETNDPESGLPHLAHIRCNTSMLLEFENTHKDLDDRPKPKS